MEKGNLRALAPIGVFLVLYLGLGILFEYVLKIEMGFYSIPIVVIFLVALLVACFQNRKLSFDDKLAIMGRGHWRQDDCHHDPHLHGSRYIRRHCRPQQRRKRRVPHAFFHST